VKSVVMSACSVLSGLILVRLLLNVELYCVFLDVLNTWF